MLEESTELCLEDPAQERPADDSCNPYNRS